MAMMPKDDFDKILDSHHNQLLDLPIHDLKLKLGDKELSQSYGRLYSKDRSLILEVYALTEAVKDLLFLPMNQRQEFAGEDKRVSCTAQTHFGANFEALDMGNPDGSASVMGHATLRFKLTTCQIGAAVDAPTRLTGFLRGLARWQMGEMSNVSDDHPVFGGYVSDTDSSTWENEQFEMVIRNQPENELRFSCALKGDTSLDVSRLTDSFLTALGFYEGRKIFTTGIRKHDLSGAPSIMLYSTSAPARPFYPAVPVVLDYTLSHSLVWKAMEFFYRQEVDDVKNALLMIWASDRTNVRSHCLQLCVSIESIINYIDENLPSAQQVKAKADFDSTKKQAVEILSGQLEKSVGATRIQNIIRSAKFKNQQQLFSIAGESLRIEVMDTEVGAWVELRNSLAHGGSIEFATNAKTSEVIVQRSVVANLLNRLSLGLFGYSGPYINYASSDWQIENFAFDANPS